MCTVKCSPLLVCDTLQQNLRVIEPRSICHTWLHDRIIPCMATLFMYRQQNFLCVRAVSNAFHRTMMHYKFLFACILDDWYACIERCSSHISRRICVQACRLLNASWSCGRHMLVLSICVCVYVHTDVCALNAQVSALRHHKNLRVHVSHASTLESKNTLWMSFGLALVSSLYRQALGHES